MSSAQLGTVLGYIRRIVATSRSNDRTDSELLDEFVSHQDQAAFAALVKRHGPMVIGVCRHVLQHQQDAEDAYQATFLVLARNAGSIRKRGALVSWLHGVAYRTAMSAKKVATRRRRYEGQVRPMAERTPFSDLAWREVQAILDEEVQRLPDKYRAPFLLCYLEGQSRGEIARQLGLVEGTVRSRLAQARMRLKQRLARRGITLSAVLSAAALSPSASTAAVAPLLLSGTVQSALEYAAGKTAVAGAVSAKVIALAEGASKTMFISKLKVATALLLAVGVGATGLGVLGHQVFAAKQPNTKQNEAPKQKPREQTRLAAAATKQEAADPVFVRGRVLDPDGKPLAGAKLYLSPSNSKETSLPVRATSGDDGRFKFTFAKSEVDKSNSDNPPPQVMAIAKDYGCDWVEVVSAEKELTLRLVKDVPISGRILDPDGKPVVGAKLTVLDVSAPKGDDLTSYVEHARKGRGFNGIAFAKDWDGPLPGQPAVLTTGAGGRFKLAGVGRERVVRFLVEGPSITSIWIWVMTRAAEGDVGGGWNIYGASFDYLALASRPIRGVVRDKETGKPVAGVSVQAGICKASTDKEGRYELLGVAKSSEYGLRAKPPDGLYFQRDVVLQEQPGLDPLTGDFEMVRALTVRGKVTDKATGKPVAQARVDYHPLGGNPNVNAKLGGAWEPRAEAITRPDGSYVLTVFPGPGVIGMTGPKPEAYMPGWVTLKERKDFFKGAIILNDPEDVLTISIGDNRFGGISQDDYNVIVLIEPGEKDEGLVKDVALEPTRTLKGHVVGPDGQPLTGVTVFGLGRRNSVETLKGAEFTVRGLNPKVNRQLVFYHKDKNLGFFVKEVRGDRSGPLTVKLQPCGSASGRMVDGDGQPVAGLLLFVTGGPMIRVQGEFQEVTTDKEGRFRADGLVPEQEYSLLYRGHGFARVLVEPGKHKDMGDMRIPDL